MKKQWWYEAYDGDFSQFLHIEAMPLDSGNYYGPFRTFSEAKADAIEFFQTTIRNARAQIADIRAIKRPKET